MSTERNGIDPYKGDIGDAGSSGYTPQAFKWFLLCTAILVLVRGGCKGYFIPLT